MKHGDAERGSMMAVASIPGDQLDHTPQTWPPRPPAWTQGRDQFRPHLRAEIVAGHVNPSKRPPRPGAHHHGHLESII